MDKPKPVLSTDKFLSLILDRLERIEQTLNASASSQSGEVKEEDKELQGFERFECDICGKQFKSSKALKMHKTKVHGNV